MGISKRIKPSLAFARMSDADLMFLCLAVIRGMTGNPDYPRPPVSLAELQKLLARFISAKAAMLNGGRKATIERDASRVELIRMMRHLGNYVEIACQNDMETFVKSGFVAIPTSFAPQQPCPQPRMLRIKQGERGVLLASFTPLYRQAVRYDLRYGARPKEGGSPYEWTLIPLSKARPATRVENLTPGTTYVFYVRAYGQLGWTDWSDPLERMCI
jgi:hypothetical protein